MSSLSFFKKKRSFLTLIEILIVIALISLVGSLVGFGIEKAKQKQLFLNESALVLKAVKLAQDLMLILNADVSLKFREGGNKIHYWIEVEGAKCDPFIRELSKKKDLKSIHVVEFDESRDHFNDNKELTLSFLSGGSFMPKGILRLSTALSSQEKNALSCYIAFPGFPVFFRTVATVDEATTINEQEQEGQELLTRFTFEEVNSLSAPLKSASKDTIESLEENHAAPS